MGLQSRTPRHHGVSHAAYAFFDGERPARRSGCVATPAVPKFDYGSADGGRLLHRVRRACMVWPDGGQPRLAVEWTCRNHTPHAVLGPYSDGRQVCPRCDWAGIAALGQSVYFARAGAIPGTHHKDELIKIGCSSDPVKRVGELQSTLVGVIPSPAAFAIERELHERFAHAHRFGEWFDAHRDLLALIDTDPRVVRV